MDVKTIENQRLFISKRCDFEPSRRRLFKVHDVIAGSCHEQTIHDLSNPDQNIFMAGVLDKYLLKSGDGDESRRHEEFFDDQLPDTL